MVFRAAALKVPTPTTHRTVTVHLRLTLKAFGLSELIALCVQSTGFAVCTCKYLAEPGEMEQTNRSFCIPLARRESLPTIVPMADSTFPLNLDGLD